MAQDPFLRSTEPGNDLAAVTPHDTDNLAQGCARGLIITVAGTVALVTPQDNVVTLPSAMAVGVIHSIRFKRINNTGTTATGLIAVF